jgi:alpha-L-fucosidase
MYNNNKFLLSFLINLLIFVSNLNSYEPDWKSLDQRPIPDWYDKAKIGM